MRIRSVIMAVAGALLSVTVAACGNGPAAQRVTAVAQSGPLPTVTGGGIRALWQGAGWSALTLSGGKLLGVSSTGSTAQVTAVSATTGAPAWKLTLPRSVPEVLGLVPAGGVVLVEAGRNDSASVAQLLVVTEYIAVDLATGHVLWTAQAGVNSYVMPPIAASGDLLLTGDAAGAVVARLAATGAVVWRDPRPKACGPAPSGGLAFTALGIAADGPLTAISFGCNPDTIVQRVDAATGRPLWTWKSSAAAYGELEMSVIAAARNGNVVLLSGAAIDIPGAKRPAPGLPHPHAWPTQLGPSEEGNAVLALDAADGQPRWSELGGEQTPVSNGTGHMETFTLTDGAVCEAVSTGVLCRNDTTGAPTFPALVAGQVPFSIPPIITDGYAGISGGLVALTVAPFRSGAVTVRVVRIQGGATAATTRLAIGLQGDGGAHDSDYVVAAGPLPGGATLLLVRRADLPGDPVLALRVPPV
jgi:outer membrane protein assembly factor BamB